MVWEDSPSHVCRGGDERAMAFCCPPVKPCPIVFALEKAGISPQKYIEIKENFGKKSRLGEGEGTCFGSLVWCCKPSKPCPLRDMVMRRIEMGIDEYMGLKKELSEELVGKNSYDTEESVKALSKTFQVPEDEAFQVLSECDNDLKTAIKVLRMKNLEL
jgi:putative methanogenesis marker domain 9